MRTTIDGAEVGYEIFGAGPALVLLHAFPLDRRMWRETAEALSSRRRVITVDFRGFGESAGVAPSVAELADDVARLLDALGVPMAAMCGLSLGGYVALAFADRHAARLAALVLADTRAGADSPDGRRARDEGAQKVRSDGAASFVAPLAARLLSANAPEALREKLRALGGAQNPDAIAAALLAMRDRPDRTSELARIRCPTLVLVGADDAITPPAEARAMAAAIPGAKFIELADAGHLSHWEAPTEFARAVDEFLAEET